MDSYPIPLAPKNVDYKRVCEPNPLHHPKNSFFAILYFCVFIFLLYRFEERKRIDNSTRRYFYRYNQQISRENSEPVEV